MPGNYLSIFLTLVFTMALNVVRAGEVSGKIDKVVSEGYRKINEPFTITFSYTDTDVTNRPVNGAPIIIPACFKQIGGIAKGESMTTISDKYGNTYSKTNSWSVTLAPVQVGDLLFPGWKLELTNGAVLISDSFWVHVYGDDAPADTVVKPKENTQKMDDLFSLFSFPDADITKPDGVTFNYSDSVYTVKVGERFEVPYSVSAVNVRGMDSKGVKGIVMQRWKAVKNFTNTNIATGSSTSSRKGYCEYTANYTVTLVAAKKGNYKLAKILFLVNGVKYKSPQFKVKVIEPGSKLI